MDKKAVHFGAGNIGRGFIASFLNRSGYEVVFADVMDSVIEQLQQTPTYTITEISTEGERTSTVGNYRAINSKTHEDDVVREIETADLVTTAVGPNVLKFIAPVIAKGIDGRKKETPVVVIACENAIKATDQLAAHIREPQNTPEQSLADLERRAIFANSAIDRIVPVQDPDMGLDVKIECFYDWVIESGPFKATQAPPIEGVHYVKHLTPYIERKLFTVNTGHATAAYYGYARGKEMIGNVMADKEIRAIVHKVLDETSKLLVDKHGFSAEDHAAYVHRILKRISNKHLDDNVVRVGRAPLRKLSRNERFIFPAAELCERGEKVDALLGAIEMCLRFNDVKCDEESVELAKILKQKSAKEATLEITGLEEDHPLFPKVEAVVAKVQG
ncbi:MAG: hypothetical protein M1819_003248 [Sarea resinae]|nr:MAG: hypothetical protein M1819_003248 [Sarea resinae]